MEIVDKLLYDIGKYWWTGSLDDLKQFVDKNLEIKGKWSSPGGNVKLFTATDSNFVIKWNGPRSQKLTMEGDDCDNYLEKFEKLSVRSQCEQAGKGKLSAKKDDTLKSLEPCVCACKCSGGITVATLEGLKLDVAILESRLNVANSYDGVVSELDSIRSKQRDVEAVIRKQDEMICKLYEDNIFLKSKLESFINLIPAGFHNNQKNNTDSNNGVVKNVCLSPTFINNENKDCASGELINEPLPRDGVINAFNPTGSTNNVNELPIMVDNEICENSNCESIRVIDDDQKLLSGVEGRLHDVEINKGVINTEVSAAKNYHNCEPHDSVNANYSTNKKVSEDECRKNTVGSNVSFSSKYQMRKSNISSKSLNESPRQSRKSDILCPYLLRRGWCKKSNRCDYSHQCIGRQTRVTPKSEVPCPFLKNRGYCLKETRCDFLHPIKHQPSTQPNIMPPHIPTYHHGPLFEPHMRRDTRSPFLFRSPWPVAPTFPPPLMNVPTWPPPTY